MNRVLVLASGGLDSSVLLAMYKKLNYEVHVLFAIYGQLNEREERKALASVCEDYNIPAGHIHVINVNIPWSQSSTLGGQGTAYVEMRNLIFISYALSLCESLCINKIALGYIKTEEDYRDTSDIFIEDIQILANRSCGVRIDTPLKDMSKWEVYLMGETLGLNANETFSCNTPIDGKPCGKCGDCLDWKEIQENIKKRG